MGLQVHAFKYNASVISLVLYAYVIFHVQATCPFHLILFNLIILILLGEQCISAFKILQGY
jgi:hypothetical protein